MTDSLATLGILALVTSGKLNPIASVLVILGLIVGIFLPLRFRQQAFLKLTGVVGPLAILAVQVVRLGLGGDPIPIIVEFAAGLQVIRLASRRGAAHDHQVILLALLHLIAGTVLGGGLTYALALLGFLIFTPGALVLSHLRREVEGNYRQGARDRTGMPVDVPRILRSRRVIGRGFLLFTCSLSVPVFLFSAVLFLAFPRVGFAWLTVPSMQPSRVVGFSDHVDLGGVGTIRTDPALVMRVKPSDMGEKPQARRNLYLRGATFDAYNGRSWSRHRGVEGHRAVEHFDNIVLRRRPRETDREMLIDLDRIDPPVIFLPGETVALELMEEIRRPQRTRTGVVVGPQGQLRYSSSEQHGIRYKVYLPPAGLIVPERTAAGDLARYLTVPDALSGRVTKLALDLTAGKTEALDIARALEKKLRAGYKYDLSSPSGQAEDPLDHFLFESKRGHCEFYSTAMAMMLRVRGVPSRNVTGFVGGTYNRFGEFYAVRQGDAHSWVEAYLPDRGWIRFDPTPPSSASPQAHTHGALALIREFAEAASQSWRQNVEGFDVEKQLGILQAVRGVFRNRDASSASSRGLARFNLRRVLLAFGGLLLIAGGIYLWMKRKNRGETLSGDSPSAHISKVIELARRLDSALEARGVPRPASTPPLTHCQALLDSGHPTGEEAKALCQIYLDLRFGNGRFSDEVVEDFGQRVARLRRPPPDVQAA